MLGLDDQWENPLFRGGKLQFLQAGHLCQFPLQPQEYQASHLNVLMDLYQHLQLAVRLCARLERLKISRISDMGQIQVPKAKLEENDFDVANQIQKSLQFLNRPLNSVMNDLKAGEFFAFLLEEIAQLQLLLGQDVEPLFNLEESVFFTVYFAKLVKNFCAKLLNLLYVHGGWDINVEFRLSNGAFTKTTAFAYKT